MEANALRCGGRCLWLWGHMPLSAWADVVGVIMEYKVGKPPCHGGSWREYAFECVNCGGKCPALWRQTPLVVGANAFECVGRCGWCDH